MADTVTLTLAHPFSAAYAERVHAQDVKDYWIGDKITVPKADAVTIINAGYATGVDPSDKAAVDKALKGGAPNKSSTTGK